MNVSADTDVLTVTAGSKQSLHSLRTIHISPTSSLKLHAIFVTKCYGFEIGSHFAEDSQTIRCLRSVMHVFQLKIHFVEVQSCLAGVGLGGGRG